MGQIYTTTGIAINFGGTAIPGNNNTAFGTGGEIYFAAGAGGTRGLLSIDALSDNIRLETDNGNITIFASQDNNSFGTVSITIGTGAILRINKNINTKIAELDANGNFRVAGTVGTGISF